MVKSPRGRYREIERAEIFEFSLGKFARVDGIHNATSVFERAAFAIAVLATSPSSVDKPAVDVVFSHTFSQHLSIAARLERNIRS